MLFTLPAVLPQPNVVGSTGDDIAVTETDTGGYDVLIGGHGFRLATDVNSPYERTTDETTSRRFDSSLEPGEQSLAQLPWIKSQSSFHAGAGQLNLEQGFTAFQYQQEQVEHIRYDMSLGIDPWTPGIVKRLPDVRFFGFPQALTCAASGASGTSEYVVAGGAYSGTLFTAPLYRFSWPSGPDADPVAAAIDLSGASFGGASNVTVLSLATDGQNYYGLVALGTAVATKTGYIISGPLNSVAAPTCLYDMTGTITGTVGWQKSRLVAGIGRSFYELAPSATAHSALPTALYTHPVSTWAWSATSESPNGILASGTVGAQSAVLEFTLDTSTGVPVLSGGTPVMTPPSGEIIYSLEQIVSSFLAVGTSRGIRVGTFDTYTGALRNGPLSVLTTTPVYDLATRDRFVYGSYTDAQPDGTTGLVTVDYSMVVDAAGRNAWAPGLRPPPSASAKTGAVRALAQLPINNRLVYLTPSGIHIEGNGPGSAGDAWMRTSRIRYDTTEPKLFKLGRIRGDLSTSAISVTGIVPAGNSDNLGTFGFDLDGNTGEFRLPTGLWEWMQLQFSLQGSTCVLNTYQVKALPAPAAQELITLTVSCFGEEVDKDGLSVTDPELPRVRWQNLKDLRSLGDEIRFVEFTANGSVAQRVVIDQLAFRTPNRPTVTDDFGGYITMRLRATES